MKKIFFYSLVACLACFLSYSYSSDLDVKQDYAFTVEYLPVPKKLGYGETAEIRCQIVREKHYEGTYFRLRYFQPDGRGRLMIDDGRVFEPNDYYALDKDEFRLYYTSQSTDQQVIDIYFFDNFNNSHTLSFTFNSVKDDGNEI